MSSSFQLPGLATTYTIGELDSNHRTQRTSRRSQT